MSIATIIILRLLVALLLVCLSIPLLLLLIYFPYPQQLVKFDAYLVLGCAPLNQSKLSQMMKSRVDEVYRQYQYKQRPIFFSGGKPFSQKSEASIMKDYAISLGIKPEHIILEEQARNTYENFRFSSPLLGEHKIKQVCIITNQFHVRRAFFFAKKFGMESMFVVASLENYLSTTQQLFLLLSEHYTRTKCMFLELLLSKKARNN